MQAKRTQPGFTLIELLVVISIIALLIAILLPVLGKAKRSAEHVRELAAARSLVQGYTMHHTENDGELVKGNLSGGPYTVTDSRGNRWDRPIADRWPWHIAEFLDYSMAGSMFVNEGEWWLSDAAVAESGDEFRWAYSVSLNTSFGLNGTFLGGVGSYSMGSPSYVTPPVTRAHQVHDPSGMIVFASAGQDAGPSTKGPFAGVVPTHFLVYPHYSAIDENSPMNAAGNVHLRLDGKSATANFDGHAELLGPDELIDRRRWSNQASIDNDPDWKPTP